MEHTALPWKVTKIGTGYYIDSGDREVARITSHSKGEDKANAEFIVKACNAYPDLVEACEMLLEHLNQIRGQVGRPYMADVKRKAIKALAKAEEEG